MLDLIQYRKLSCPVSEVLVAAVAAYRINGNEVKRYQYGVNIDGNKELIIKHFTGNPLEITEQDRLVAAEIIPYLTQRRMISALTNTPSSDFFNTVTDFLINDTIKGNQFGVIAWAPKMYYQLVKNDNIKNDVLSICASSKYIGEVGKPITLVFQKLNERYMRHYDRWEYTGHDGKGNLISFFIKEKMSFDMYNIKARVKNHARSDQYNRLSITYLNYVKEVNEE